MNILQLAELCSWNHEQQRPDLSTRKRSAPTQTNTHSKHTSLIKATNQFVAWIEIFPEKQILSLKEYKKMCLLLITNTHTVCHVDI